MERAPRILIAGIGNVLRGDDGFGPAVVQALGDWDRPPQVTLVEMGIAGVDLVRCLMDGYEVLVIIDAVDRNAEPGTLYELEPIVPHLETLSAGVRREVSADMHETVPERALILARAAGALPPFVRIVGCQPLETDELAMRLSAPVRAAVPRAAARVREIVRHVGRHPTGPHEERSIEKLPWPDAE